MCLCSHTDCMTSVGVSNSCLYHHSSARSVKHWHLHYCSITVLIVTLCQKVPYAKPQKLRICHEYWKSCILCFFVGLWEVGQCQKMCSGPSGKPCVLKNDKKSSLPSLWWSLCTSFWAKTTLSGRQMTVTGPESEKSPFSVLTAFGIIHVSVWKVSLSMCVACMHFHTQDIKRLCCEASEMRKDDSRW